MCSQSEEELADEVVHEADEVRVVARQEEDEASDAVLQFISPLLTFPRFKQVDSPAAAHQEAEVASQAVEEHQVVVEVSQAEADHPSEVHPGDEVDSAVAGDNRWGTLPVLVVLVHFFSHVTLCLGCRRSRGTL